MVLDFLPAILNQQLFRGVGLWKNTGSRIPFFSGGNKAKRHWSILHANR